MNERENLLGFIGLCHKAGRLSLGYEKTLEEMSASRARLVILSTDAGETTKKRVLRSASENNVKVLELFSKQELGDILGSGDAAVVAVKNAGFAKAILKKAGNLNER